MSAHTYDIDDSYNVFGANHHKVVTLYQGDHQIGVRHFKTDFPGWRGRLDRHIRRLRNTYGAVPR